MKIEMRAPAYPDLTLNVGANRQAALATMQAFAKEQNLSTWFAGEKLMFGKRTPVANANPSSR